MSQKHQNLRAKLQEELAKAVDPDALEVEVHDDPAMSRYTHLQMKELGIDKMRYRPATSRGETAST